MLCDPSADFAFAPGHADAALLATKNAITAAILKVRLDTGSPPFFANRHMPYGKDSRGARGEQHGNRGPAPFVPQRRRGAPIRGWRRLLCGAFVAASARAPLKNFTATTAGPA